MNTEWHKNEHTNIQYASIGHSHETVHTSWTPEVDWLRETSTNREQCRSILALPLCNTYNYKLVTFLKKKAYSYLAIIKTVSRQLPYVWNNSSNFVRLVSKYLIGLNEIFLKWLFNTTSLPLFVIFLPLIKVSNKYWLFLFNVI